MMGMGRFTGFAAVAGTMGVLASLVAPAEAFTQKGVGLVTAIRGSVNVAHTADVAARERRPVQEPLRFREDVFFLDTIRTEREATAKLLLRARSTLTIRELSQVQLREGTAPAPGRASSRGPFGPLSSGTFAPRTNSRSIRRTLSPPSGDPRWPPRRTARARPLLTVFVRSWISCHGAPRRRGRTSR